MSETISQAQMVTITTGAATDMPPQHESSQQPDHSDCIEQKFSDKPNAVAEIQPGTSSCFIEDPLLQVYQPSQNQPPGTAVLSSLNNPDWTASTSRSCLASTSPSSTELDPGTIKTVPNNHNHEQSVDLPHHGVYSISRKFYLGKKEDFPVPEDVIRKYETTIYSRLESDIVHILRSLESYGERVEPDVCMAGYRKKWERLVILKPTLLLRCSSKRCKKAIQNIANLTYVINFFHGRIEIHTEAAILAAGSNDYPLINPEDLEGIEIDGFTIYLHLENPLEGSACGLRLLITVMREKKITHQQTSVVGGLIQIDKITKALTTGHGLLELPKKVLQERISADSNFEHSVISPDSEDSDSVDLQDSDDSGEFEWSNDKDISSRHHVAPRSFPATSDSKTEWIPVIPPHLGCWNTRSLNGHQLGTTDNNQMDFALLTWPTMFPQVNRYKDKSQSITVNDIVPESELTDGPVKLVFPNNSGMNGYLTSDPCITLSQAGSSKTRRIQVNFPFDRGLSGTWIVRGNKLCGILIGVYKSDPYVQMLPAETMLTHIRMFIQQQSIISPVVEILKLPLSTSSTSQKEKAQSDELDPAIQAIRAALESRFEELLLWVASSPPEPRSHPPLLRLRPPSSQDKKSYKTSDQDKKGKSPNLEPEIGDETLDLLRPRRFPRTGGSNTRESTDSSRNQEKAFLEILREAARFGLLELVKKVLAQDSTFSLRNWRSLKDSDVQPWYKTALIEEASVDNVRAVKTLMAAVVDANDQEMINQANQEALLIAAKAGHIQVPEILLVSRKDTRDEDLLLAAESNNLRMMNMLIEAGAAVNHDAGTLQPTLLQLAAGKHNIDMVRTLLKAGADPNIISRGSSYQKTAIYVATQKGDFDMVKMLLEAKADPNVPDSVSGQMPLHEAAIIKDLRSTKLLLDAGALVNAKDTIEGRTALHYAAEYGQINIIELLLKAGAEINAIDRNHQTAFMLSFKAQGLMATKYLLSAGSDVNLQDNSGRTALHLAAKKGAFELFHTLIEHGIDINAQDQDGKTALIYAIEHGKYEPIERLLKAGANINIRDKDRESALITAIRTGNHWAVKRLLAQNADINVTNSAGQDTISIARSSWNYAVLVVILEAKINASTWNISYPTPSKLDHLTLNRRIQIAEIILAAQDDVNTHSSGHRTALMEAASIGHTKLLQRLLEKGADIDVQDANGRTAIREALEKGYLEILQLIAKARNHRISHPQATVVEASSPPALTVSQFQSFELPSSSCTALRFLSSSEQLAIGTESGETLMFDYTGTKVSEYRGHEEMVTKIVLPAAGNWIASAAVDGKVRLWERENARIILTHQKPAVALAISADNNFLASASKDGEVKLWDHRSTETKTILGLAESSVTAIAFSSNDLLIAQAASATKIFIYNTATFVTSQRQLQRQEPSADAVAFSPNGQKVAFAPSKGVVKLWSTSSGNLICTLDLSDTLLRSLNFSFDGFLMASASGSGIVSIWECITGQLVAVFNSMQRPQSIAFSTDGTKIATADGNGPNIKIWDISTSDHST